MNEIDIPLTHSQIGHTNRSQSPTITLTVPSVPFGIGSHIFLHLVPLFVLLPLVS